jgi:hypothetical protein
MPLAGNEWCRKCGLTSEKRASFSGGREIAGKSPGSLQGVFSFFF